MISFRINPKGIKTLRELASELRYISSTTFFRSLPTHDFADRALSVLKKYFPRSGANSTRLEHLIDGWRSRITETQKGVALEIFHKDENQPRTQTILKSLDRGSRAYSFTSPDDMTFYGKYRSPNKAGKTEGWITIPAGQTVQKSARSALDYTGKTAEYIRDKMIPEFKALIEQRIKNRIERVR